MNNKSKPLKLGFINIGLVVLFYILIIFFSKTDNSLVGLFSFLIFLLGFILSVKGLFLSMKGVRNKRITTVDFLFSVLLNLIFPLIFTLLIMVNLKDFRLLFNA